MGKWLRRLRVVFYGLILLALAGALFWFFAPRPPLDTSISFDSAALGDDLETYLAGQEAKFTDIRPDDQKQIVWAYPISKARTPLAIVYVHGFSASPAEVRPLPDEVAKALGANLYFTRLAGHGRADDAMAEGSIHAWVNDFAEAMAIGRKLGEKIIVIATSTGGSLATWAAANPALNEDLAGLVLISPNYGVQAKGSFLLTGPYADWFVAKLIGARRGFEPHNAEQAAHWTTDYPSSALIPMQQSVNMAKGTDVARIKIPALFIFSPDDQVVKPEQTRRMAANWGAAHEIVEVAESGDPSHHVIAGNILSPETTGELTGRIVAWIKAL